MMTSATARLAPAPALWRRVYDVLVEARRAQRVVARYAASGRPLPEDLARRLNEDVFCAGPRR
jgi:hypothetical protein